MTAEECPPTRWGRPSIGQLALQMCSELLFLLSLDSCHLPSLWYSLVVYVSILSLISQLLFIRDDCSQLLSRISHQLISGSLEKSEQTVDIVVKTFLDLSHSYLFCPPYSSRCATTLADRSLCHDLYVRQVKGRSERERTAIEAKSLSTRLYLWTMTCVRLTYLR